MSLGIFVQLYFQIIYKAYEYISQQDTFACKRDEEAL